MNIKKWLLSGLFTLISGSAMMGAGTKSEAEVTSWAPGFPSVSRDPNVPPVTFAFQIKELCQATSEGSNDLNWTSVRYIIAGTFDKTFSLSQSIPHGQTATASKSIQLGGLSAGSYDCLAIASGTDSVTGDSWVGSTGDTWVVAQ